ncbi:MAG: helix-turn-helix domain-containing protein [Actinobacteria bacterium]|nr:helix-turn-helix domain-containing protein [Actinomycetota bacterium]
MTLPRAHAFGGRSHAISDPAHVRSERIWEQRRALGRRLAALRSRSGFSQWEFAPLTGYSRSTLSDAELGRHRLRREFWQRCDDALQADGALTAAYDRIEVQATAVRRSARSQAQAAREQQASARLHALMPASAPVADPESPMTVTEQCPHCRQPVTVIIVPGQRSSRPDSAVSDRQ